MVLAPSASYAEDGFIDGIVPSVMRSCTLETHGTTYRIQSGEKLLLLHRARVVLEHALLKKSADIRNYERVALAEMIGNCRGTQMVEPTPQRNGTCTLHFTNGDSTTVSPGTVMDFAKFLAELPNKSWGGLVPRDAIQAVVAATSDCIAAADMLKEQQSVSGELVASAE